MIDFRKRAADQLVLSLFSGVGLLDRAFAAAGFCVVSGPELITGGDVRTFAVLPGRFDGLIAGPPCQGFSAANVHRSDPNHHSVVNSREMLRHTCRIIDECQPLWFVVENVPGVPDVRVACYDVQRLHISDWECGGCQIRVRAIQFGHRLGHIIRPVRVNDRTQNRKKGRPLASVTTKTDRHTDFPDHCRKQGLDEPLQLPGWTKTAKFRAVGNGVPLRIGRAVAAAVLRAGPATDSDCPCGCGRILEGKQQSATVTCRKRLQLQRERARPFVDLCGYHDWTETPASAG